MKITKERLGMSKFFFWDTIVFQGHALIFLPVVIRQIEKKNIEKMKIDFLFHYIYMFIDSL